MSSENIPHPIEVPLESLSPEILRAVIESFILREGTDYGVSEASMEKKFQDIQRQVIKKEIKVVFDFETESVNLLTLAQWKVMMKN